jgi:predicted MFS family arabinose efflux permease
MGWKLLNTMAVVTGILLIMISLSNSPLLLGTFLLFWTFSVLINVLTQGVIQREIPSEERATITSVNSLITETGAVILGLIFGFIANRYGIQIGYGFYGLIIITYLSVKFTIERLR